MRRRRRPSQSIALLFDLLPAQGARGFGLYLLDRVGPLHRAAMREGIVPTLAGACLTRREML